MNKRPYPWTKLLLVLMLLLGAAFPAAAVPAPDARAAPRPQGLLFTVDSTLDTPIPRHQPVHSLCPTRP